MSPVSNIERYHVHMFHLISFYPPPCVMLCQENFDLLYSSMDTDSNGKIDFEEVRISIFPFMFTKE